MGLVADILDANRRRGRPTERSALRRQDEQLAGHAVLARGRTVGRTDSGSAEQFTATINAVEESVNPLSDDQVRAIEENASLAIDFVRASGVTPAEALTLDDLDCAFATWLHGDDDRGYSAESVVELLGAVFGQFCVEKLHMRWVTIEDADGTVIALQGREKDVRGFPYHSIEKRIADRETGFFRAVFAALQDAAGKDYRWISSGD
jgi:hypothetical protein